jgi:hypothetical protein
MGYKVVTIEPSAVQVEKVATNDRELHPVEE